jgi:hypothetical protein
VITQSNPFAWERCDHSGIGQPGCPTCDPDKYRCLQRARYVAYVEVCAEREECARIVTAAADAADYRAEKALDAAAARIRARRGT